MYIVSSECHLTWQMHQLSDPRYTVRRANSSWYAGEKSKTRRTAQPVRQVCMRRGSRSSVQLMGLVSVGWKESMYM
jgi:hypothetical protein